MNKRDERKQHLERHYQNCAQLVALCGGNKTGKQASVLLWKAEQEYHKFAVKLANEGASDEEWDMAREMARERVVRALGSLPKGFYLNSDPRGYALKLEENSVNIPLERDRGGYQLLSPEI